MDKNICLIPVSLGELYDKYTILKIKETKVKDVDKLLFIKTELNYLSAHINKYSLDENIYNELKQINEELWDIEDNIRDKEHKNEFDSEFILLARNVYKRNDKRNLIKNKISKLLNSNLLDIKNYSKYESDLIESNIINPSITNDQKLIIDNYKEKINLNPNNNNYLIELGEYYEKINMFNKAIVECYLKIIKNDKNNGIILNQIGVCYFNIQQYKLAIHYFNKVLNIKELPQVYSNIATAYVKMLNYKDAEKMLLRSYEIDCDNEQNKYELVQLYYQLKDYDKSIYYFTKINNSTNKIKYSVSFTYLANKDFIKGFELYEYRLTSNEINPQTNLIERLDIPSLNLWNGKDNCNNLLIVSEQGFGDNIQYYRFIIELSTKYPNMKISFFCRNEISHLFKTYNNIEIKKNILLHEYDYKIYLMSLPYILKLSDITYNQYNYININNDKLLFWNNKISKLKKFKIGFVYKGLLNSYIQKNIPLNEFEFLTALDIDLICLHKKSDIIDDITNIKFKDKITFYDIDTDTPFEDTICLLKSIDLLITIDTFIVHLAGVLNIKTWLLLGQLSEWRWSNDDFTYWYKSVELIRNHDDFEFKNILKIVKTKLINLLDEL